MLNPLKTSPGRSKTPLTVGMFVSIRIKGISVPEIFVLPRFSVKSTTRKGKLSNTVFLYKDGKLKIKNIDILRKNMNKVFVENGLQDGDKVIVSPLPDAVEGMKLRKIETRDTRK